MIDAQHMEGSYTPSARGCTATGGCGSARGQTYLIDSLEPDYEVGYPTIEQAFVPSAAGPVTAASGPSIPILLGAAAIVGGLLYFAAAKSRQY